MQLNDVKTGAKVQFVTLRNGKRVGLDKEIYTIIKVNFNDWESCNVLLECNGSKVFTNHEAIELATDAALKEWEGSQVLKQLKAKEQPKYKQITIFDLLEEI